MKCLLVVIVFHMLGGTVACGRQGSGNQASHDIWKGEPEHVLTMSQLKTEIDEKLHRLRDFLKVEELRGVFLTQVRNVQWITAGLANTEIELSKEGGAGSLLILDDGSRYLVSTASESDRLMDESLGKLGYELRMFNWYENTLPIIREFARNGRIGSDTNIPGTVYLAAKIRKLRYRLTDSEIEKYRWLGKQTAEAVEAVCNGLEPGMDEYQMEAMTAAELRSRGIRPTVLLMGVDDRIFKYRHALPGGAELEKYGMVNVCAEKWGLIVAVTRFVHFGPLPEELKHKVNKTARVNAYYEAATVPGKSCGEIFEACKTWYAEVGYEGEWQKHHQGGAIGYDNREYVIGPSTDEKVQDRQAFAWNPTITGVKVENTIIAFQDHVEVLTRTANWPTIDVEIDGKIHKQPAILIK